MHEWKWIGWLEQCFQIAIDWTWKIARLYLTNIGELFSSQGRMEVAFVVTLIFVLVLGRADIKQKWQGVSGKAALWGYREAQWRREAGCRHRDAQFKTDIHSYQMLWIDAFRQSMSERELA